MLNLLDVYNKVDFLAQYALIQAFSLFTHFLKIKN